MKDQIQLLERLIETSEVSHRECAELITMVRQARFYIDFRAASGDLYAQNISQQIKKEVTHAS